MLRRVIPGGAMRAISAIRPAILHMDSLPPELRFQTREGKTDRTTSHLQARNQVRSHSATAGSTTPWQVAHVRSHMHAAGGAAPTAYPDVFRGAVRRDDAARARRLEPARSGASIEGTSRLGSGSPGTSIPARKRVRGQPRSWNRKRVTFTLAPAGPGTARRSGRVLDASPPESDPLGVVSRTRARNARPGPCSKGPRNETRPHRSALTCARCGDSFPIRLRGRTRRYCGVPCRRDVEYEVRRVRRRLARRSAELTRRLELDRANRGLLSTLRGLDGSTWAGDTDDLRVEIAVLRRRLHSLHHPSAAARGRKELLS